MRRYATGHQRGVESRRRVLRTGRAFPAASGGALWASPVMRAGPSGKFIRCMLRKGWRTSLLDFWGCVHTAAAAAGRAARRGTPQKKRNALNRTLSYRKRGCAGVLPKDDCICFVMHSPRVGRRIHMYQSKMYHVPSSIAGLAAALVDEPICLDFEDARGGDA